jgi:hypothetical protein
LKNKEVSCIMKHELQNGEIPVCGGNLGEERIP